MRSPDDYTERELQDMYFRVTQEHAEQLGPELTRLSFIHVPKLLAGGQVFARLAHDGVDCLAALPPLPQGDGGQGDQLGAVRDRGRRS
jgi:hypothetical protein